MSSATTAPAAAAAAAAVEEDTAVKAPRKFPTPCWTQDETLVLIDEYRERWYALRRGYLRTADWDAVAASVADRCPDASPTKTSAQCRHKMEKLRQRYRAEKQRSLAYPYPARRFVSSWFFFEYMEAMENGTAPPMEAQKPENSADGSRLNSFFDHNTLKLKIGANTTSDSSTDLGSYNGAKAKRFNWETKMSDDDPSYFNVETVDKEEYDAPMDEDHINFGILKRINGMPIPHLKSKTKNSGKNFHSSIEFSDGIPQDKNPPGKRAKNFRNLNGHNNFNAELWGNNFVAPDHRADYGVSLNPNLGSRAAAMKRSNAVEEMVASIRLLGEGFMKMERAKMEMAREMEEMRMNVELKRNKTILESQKQMVDAFVKGLLEFKQNKKLKSTTTDSREV